MIAEPSEYEKIRNQTVLENRGVLQLLGLGGGLTGSSAAAIPHEDSDPDWGEDTPNIPAATAAPPSKPKPALKKAAATAAVTRASASTGTTELVELQFDMPPPGGPFKLLAFVSLVGRGARSLESTLFVLQSVKQELCPDLETWKWKKQCSKKNSTISKYFADQLIATSSGELAAIKTAHSGLCKANTPSLNLAPLPAVVEFLSANDKGRHAMCIESGFLAALAAVSTDGGATGGNSISNVGAGGGAKEQRGPFAKAFGQKYKTNE